MQQPDLDLQHADLGLQMSALDLHMSALELQISIWMNWKRADNSHDEPDRISKPVLPRARTKLVFGQGDAKPVLPSTC